MRNGFGAEKGGEITSDEDKAYQKMKKKFWIAVALSIPVFVIAMSDVFGFLHLDSLAPKKVLGWVEFALATPVVFYSSWDFFKRGWSSIVSWMPNMWTLISIGGVGAAICSVYLRFWFPPLFRLSFRMPTAMSICILKLPL